MRLQHVRQRLVSLLPLLAREQHRLLSSVQQDLAVVEKVHLEKLVAEPEHDRMPCFQPLLDVDKPVVSFILDLVDLHLFDLFVEVHYKSL